MIPNKKIVFSGFWLPKKSRAKEGNERKLDLLEYEIAHWGFSQYGKVKIIARTLTWK